MEFIESPLFSKLIASYLTDDDYAALQWELAVHPEAGDLIQASGGLRKFRWAAKGHGKRGGIRIIYYFKSRASQIWLLTVYAKGEAETLPLKVLQRIKQELDL